MKEKITRVFGWYSALALTFTILVVFRDMLSGLEAAAGFAGLIAVFPIWYFVVRKVREDMKK